MLIYAVFVETEEKYGIYNTFTFIFMYVVKIISNFTVE